MQKKIVKENKNINNLLLQEVIKDIKKRHLILGKENAQIRSSLKPIFQRKNQSKNTLLMFASSFCWTILISFGHYVISKPRHSDLVEDYHPELKAEEENSSDLIGEMQSHSLTEEESLPRSIEEENSLSIIEESCSMEKVSVQSIETKDSEIEQFEDYICQIKENGHYACADDEGNYLAFPDGMTDLISFLKEMKHLIKPRYCLPGRLHDKFLPVDKLVQLQLEKLWLAN